jgi:hypothetical protein
LTPSTTASVRIVFLTSEEDRGEDEGVCDAVEVTGIDEFEEGFDDDFVSLTDEITGPPHEETRKDIARKESTINGYFFMKVSSRGL